MRRVSAIRALGALALSGSGARAALGAQPDNAALSRAGRGGTYRIAFASFGPIDSTLFIANGDGTAPRALLAQPGRDYNASFALDGAWIAFTSERAGTAHIFRVRLDGSRLQQLTNGQSFNDQGALSPDGNSLAFVSDRGGRANVWLLDIGSGVLTSDYARCCGRFPARVVAGRSMARLFVRSGFPSSEVYVYVATFDGNLRCTPRRFRTSPSHDVGCVRR